jgi:hypothetical protein
VVKQLLDVRCYSASRSFEGITSLILEGEYVSGVEIGVRLSRTISKEGVQILQLLMTKTRLTISQWYGVVSAREVVFNFD